MVLSILYKTDLFLALILILVATCGDYFVSHSKIQMYKALFDNVTHAMIGGISWLIVCVHHKNYHTCQTLLEIMLCTMIASFIDLDHFYKAHSFLLKDAVQLSERPPLHSTTTPILISIALIILSYCLDIRWIQKFALILLLAFLSHHLRDATRRGFWFPPLGSTRPVPYILYISGTIALPYLVSVLMKHFKHDKAYQYNTSDV